MRFSFNTQTFKTSLRYRIGLGVLTSTVVALVAAIVISILFEDLKGSADLVAETSQTTKDETSAKALLATDLRLHVVQVQQWLTDISATRAAEGFDDGYVEAEGHAVAFREGIDSFKSAFQAAGNLEEIEHLESIAEAFEGYYSAGKEMAQAYIDGGPELGNLAMGCFGFTSGADLPLHR